MSYNPLTIDQIVSQVNSDIKNVFGSDINLTPTTPEEQLVVSFSNSIYKLQQVAVNSYASLSLASAQKEMLDSLGFNLRIIRKGGSSTIVQGVVITGTDGTVVPYGFVAQTTSGNKFYLSQSVTISGTTATGTFLSAVQDSVPCEAGQLTNIPVPLSGVTSITNPNSGILGNKVESDGSYRRRIVEGAMAYSTGVVGSVQSALRNVSGVETTYVYQNTGIPSAPLNTPTNSMSIFIDYNDTGINNAIAESILSTSLNLRYANDTPNKQTVTLNDIAGTPQVINWEKATQVQLYITIDLSVNSKYGPSISETLSTALVEYINFNHTLGGTFYYTQIVGKVSDLIEGVIIESLYIGTSPNPITSIDVSCQYNEIFYLSPSNVVVN